MESRDRSARQSTADTSGDDPNYRRSPAGGRNSLRAGMTSAPHTVRLASIIDDGVTSVTSHFVTNRQDSADNNRRFLETNVRDNFLADSQAYGGFTYLLKHYDMEVVEEMRNTLFPALAHALEAMMKEVVAEQLRWELQTAESVAAAFAKKKVLNEGASATSAATTASEVRAAKESFEHAVINEAQAEARNDYYHRATSMFLRKKEKSFRGRPTYPTQEIKLRTDPIQILAKELKKRAGGNDFKFDRPFVPEWTGAVSGGDNGSQGSDSFGSGSGLSSAQTSRPGSAVKR